MGFDGRIPCYYIRKIGLPNWQHWCPWFPWPTIWEVENCWCYCEKLMLQTMEPSLLNLVHTLLTVKEIWDIVNRMFYDGSKRSQLYELWCQATHLKQEGRSIATYFAELKATWLELDKRCLFQMKCANYMKTFQNTIIANVCMIF